MIQYPQAPFVAHVFICTNDRNGARKSCADGNSSEMKDQLKAAVAAKGWKGIVRVSSSGCLGVCADGPNIMIYPQGLWFSDAGVDDLDELMRVLTSLVDQAS